MELSTKRLFLKEMTLDDVDLIHHLHCTSEVEQFNTIGIPRHKGDTIEVILSAVEDRESKNRTQFAWTVWAAGKEDFLGEAGISLSGDRFQQGEIHYSLLPAHWEKGYGTELVKRIISFGFKELKLHRVHAGVATENHRSIRVLEKAGMTREGLHRRILPIRGEWKDNYHYAIVEDDPFVL
ncbi:GNAT family N-acetyltransferase [Persicitalea jodogahamensis]|uniref:N-acetyltransferase domain-containing protein n=1 Tax=Persicitalea jodogahamensis TaxID=402147 RepID=A0A8J3D481_9BACT|nr:GNAT family protein [Persicitalea jodogahamensis]GHB80632.1 hypothetical protein GCM10007390_38790 [Persicitalea jodogahamensis]